MTMERTDESIVSYMENIYHSFHKLEDQSLTSKRHQLSINEWHILDRIGQKTKLRIGELAAAAGVTLASMTVAIDKLEKKGFLYRERAPDDRRGVLIVLTRRGQAAYIIHRRFHKAMLDVMLDGLTEQEVTLLAEAFAKLERFISSTIG